jgi:two-component system, OmpR family, response regulator
MVAGGEATASRPAGWSWYRDRSLAIDPYEISKDARNYDVAGGLALDSFTASSVAVSTSGMSRTHAMTRCAGRSKSLDCAFTPDSESYAQKGGDMRCLVIEDEAETGSYIGNGLKEYGFAVTQCGDGADGLHLATNEPWDVIVLDRMLPGKVDGLTIVSTLRSLGKTTPVLILSALASLDERVRGLQSGSDDYLTKPFAFSELLARVEALLRRSGMKEDVSELRVSDLTLDLRRRKAERAAKPIALQPREFRLLEYLVRHQGQVVTRTMLLEAVWDYHFDPQTNAVDVQISRLRQKIDKEFSPALLHTIRGVGYMLSPDV